MPRVLVVEDNPFVRTALCELLVACGFVAQATTDGHQALAALDRHPDVALVLLDWHMPGMGGEGFRAAQLAHPQWHTLPTVVLSGDVDALAQLPALRGVHLVPKPIDVPALLALVQRCLAAEA